ncbi:MAG: hypothetical protein KAG82_05100 [Alcanivoracaceae bacterium]|nr:hypothetical protein [Alcanivoracaceae bacterium]
MTPRLLFCTLLAISTAGCTVVEETSSSPYGRIGIAVPEPEVALEQWQAPEQVGNYRLQGTLHTSHSELRLFRYVDPARPTENIEMAIYPLPGGWEDLAPMRVVDGHFPQPREAEMVRLIRHSQADVREELHASEAHPDLLYPIAISEFHALRSDYPLGSLLMLTADLPVFIRLRLETNDPDLNARIPAMRDMLLAFRAGLVRHGGS